MKSNLSNVIQLYIALRVVFPTQLGLLLACDWLLSLRVSLWENHGNEVGVASGIRQGFYQDLETLSKLVTLLPAGRSRVGVIVM